MSFCKHYMSISTLCSLHINNMHFDEDMERIIRKTDCFIFEDQESENVINLWISDKNEAMKIINNFISV